MALRSINTLAIGAGGCGLEMGLHLSGVPARPVCYVEREAFAAANLVQKIETGRLAPAPIWDDARTFDGRPWRGVVDLIASGYPCQPFSAAGKGLGEADPRHLWPTLRRIIGEVEPGVCFFENSPRHVKHGLDKVWRDLRELGFWVEAGLFSAQEAGADHIRERLFILATNPNKFPLRKFPERGQGRTQATLKRDTEPRHDGEAGPVPDADRARLEGAEPEQEGRGTRPADVCIENDPDADLDGLEGFAEARLHAQGQRGHDADGLCSWYDGLSGEPWDRRSPIPVPSLWSKGCVECGLFGVVNGLAMGLDLDGVTYGDVTEQRVRALWPDLSRKEIQKRIWRIQAAALLRDRLPERGAQERRPGAGCLQQEGAEAPEGGVRDLRGFREAAGASQGSELAQQQPFQLDDAVHILSLVIASRTGRLQETEKALSRLRVAIGADRSVWETQAAQEKVWGSASYEEKIEWLLGACAGVANSQRNHRLFVAGNGVVPPVAALAFDTLGAKFG